MQQRSREGEKKMKVERGQGGEEIMDRGSEEVKRGRVGLSEVFIMRKTEMGQRRERDDRDGRTRQRL